HQVETEFVIGISRYPTADLRRAPAGLEQNIERQHHNKQGNQKIDEQLSNKFHGLPSRETHIKELCTIYAQCSRREWCKEMSRQALTACRDDDQFFSGGKTRFRTIAVIPPAAIPEESRFFTQS